jgi:4-alpha-glucanotransferase
MDYYTMGLGYFERKRTKDGQKNKRARNDLPCTTMDTLVSGHDLPTMTEQFTTHDSGLFDHAGYLHGYTQPLGCI